jgi:hypothetical protein
MKTFWLMLSREIVSVVTRNLTEHIHCGKNVEFLVFKPGGRYSYECALNQCSLLISSSSKRRILK